MLQTKLSTQMMIKTKSKRYVKLMKKILLIILLYLFLYKYICTISNKMIHKISSRWLRWKCSVKHYALSRCTQCTIEILTFPDRWWHSSILARASIYHVTVNTAFRIPNNRSWRVVTICARILSTYLHR